MCAMNEKTDTERRLLEAACLEFGIDSDLVEALISIERDNERRFRRRGLFTALRGALDDHVMERHVDSS